MRARIDRAWLVAFVALAGCIEPSKIENADELIAAASLRDGSVDLLPSGGGGGSAGRSGSGGAGGSGAGGRSGSGGAGGTGGTAASDCGDIVATFLVPTCATEFCHGAMGTTSPLKLLATDTAASLIGTDASMMCDGELYIDPDAPEKSLLYTKLGAKPPCGLRMPFGGTPATDAQRACVLQWIMDEVAAAQ